MSTASLAKLAALAAALLLSACSTTPPAPVRTEKKTEFTPDSFSQMPAIAPEDWAKAFEAFCKKAGTIILLSCIILWFLASYDTGLNYIGDNTLFALYQKETEKAQEIKIAQVGDEFNANLTTGVSISYVLKPQLGIRLFFDYSLNPAKFDTEYFVEIPQSESGRSQTILHSMTLGASVNVMLW